MNIEQIEEEVNARLEALIESIVTKKIAELVLDPEALAQRVLNSPTLRRVIGDRIEQSVATIVGNRLRCEVYNGFDMDKVFESIWPEQFDTAIKDRARRVAENAVKEAIKSIVTNIKS